MAITGQSNNKEYSSSNTTIHGEREMEKISALQSQIDIMENVLGHSRVVGTQSASETEASVFIMNPEGPEKRSAKSYIGTGISKMGDNEYRVGIYCQREEDLESDLVKRAVELADGEVNLQFVGLVTAGQNIHAQAGSNILKVGGSIGHTAITAGTLGLFVRDNLTGETVILSNNHVLANNNNAVVGDNIVAPGPIDGGTVPTDIAGYLLRFKAIDMTPGAINYVDGALSTISTGRSVCGNIVSGIPGLPNNKIIRSNIGVVGVTENVHKLGRTTGGTTGEVTDTNVHIYVSFNTSAVAFSDQIAISSRTGRFSAGGDSGSAILNDSGEVVALLFAGSDVGGQFNTGVTFANPIQRVFTALDIGL